MLVLFSLKRKRRDHKPVSVFESAIYLRNLPPGNGQATLDCQYIWSCSPRNRTRGMSPCRVVSSCLAFSPLRLKRGCFLLRPSRDYSRLRFPQRGALCCPDFPLLRQKLNLSALLLVSRVLTTYRLLRASKLARLEISNFYPQ